MIVKDTLYNIDWNDRDRILDNSQPALSNTASASTVLEISFIRDWLLSGHGWDTSNDSNLKLQRGIAN